MYRSSSAIPGQSPSITVAVDHQSPAVPSGALPGDGPAWTLPAVDLWHPTPASSVVDHSGTAAFHHETDASRSPFGARPMAPSIRRMDEARPLGIFR